MGSWLIKREARDFFHKIGISGLVCASCNLVITVIRVYNLCWFLGATASSNGSRRYRSRIK